MYNKKHHHYRSDSGLDYKNEFIESNNNIIGSPD